MEMNKREFVKKAMLAMDKLTGNYRWVPSRTEMKIEITYLYEQLTKTRKTRKSAAALRGGKRMRYTAIEKIGIYNENTKQAGRRCLDENMIERKSEDITIYSAETVGDWIEIRELAEAYLNNTLNGGEGAFLREEGRTLRSWYEEKCPIEINGREVEK